MQKVSSRNLLALMRVFNIANESNFPKNIDHIELFHPVPTNTLISFRYNRKQYYALFDESIDDNLTDALAYIKTKDANIDGHFVVNPMEESIKTYAVPFKGKDCYLLEENVVGGRLDAELAKRFPDKSRSTWQKLIKLGKVKVNSKTINEVNFQVSNTDNVAYSDVSLQAKQAVNLPIIYIDDNVIVINKPAGILTHSKGALNEEFTVADFFEKYTTYNLNTNRPGIIHRLDRDTSGVMIGARNYETAEILKKQFSNRLAHKTYLAVLRGTPKNLKAIIDLPIERNPSKPSTFRVGPNGKTALTKYEVLSILDKYSLVKLIPRTGRTHQLRVHMCYINTPILGDRVYGEKADRLYLHAESLEITIPQSNRQIFKAPVPEEFYKYFPELKND